MTLAIDRFDHIVLNVKDVETSAAWYEQVLGMKREDFESRSGKRVSVKFGQQKINLRPVGEDTQLYQVLRIDQQKLVYESRTATGRLYDAFELQRRADGSKQLIEHEAGRIAPRDCPRSATLKGRADRCWE